MTRYSEDELVPISALQHLAFCPRQCALIHLDRIWTENRLTAEGRLLHERAHEGSSESRPDRRIVRGLRIRSLQFGITGISDVVEFVKTDAEDQHTIRLRGVSGFWRPHPVEYKRGRPKKDSCDEIQLCAQALCLEEMLETSIDFGSLYYGKNRKRSEVSFDAELRRETIEAIQGLHRLFSSERLPSAVPEKKCNRCSLRDECLPEVTTSESSASSYVSDIVHQLCSKRSKQGRES